MEDRIYVAPGFPEGFELAAVLQSSTFTGAARSDLRKRTDGAIAECGEIHGANLLKVSGCAAGDEADGTEPRGFRRRSRGHARVQARTDVDR